LILCRTTAMSRSQPWILNSAGRYRDSAPSLGSACLDSSSPEQPTKSQSSVSQTQQRVDTICEDEPSATNRIVRLPLVGCLDASRLPDTATAR
jgi:hypothetical protein